MLKKLMKYDLASIFKVLVIFYSLAMVFGLLTRWFSGFENSLVMDIIFEICLGATISMMCSTLINNLMRMWVRFKSNLYGDESYLSHTLPVRKSTHYLSKILTSVITLFVSFAVIGAVLFATFYSKENLQSIKTFLQPLAQMYDSSVLGIIAALLVVLFLEFLNILQCGLSGIILGHRRHNAKNGFSVLYGFAAFMLSQMVVLAVVFVPAIFDKDFMNLFVTEDVISISVLKTAIITAIIAYTLVAVIICFVNIKLLKKGVNVD